MSQISISSATSAFSPPINVHNGGVGRNTKTTHLDKAVGSVTSIQKNAKTIKQAIPILDSVLATIDGIVFNGKRDAVAKLKGLKMSLLEVAKALEVDAITLSPIPGMAYAHSRKQTQEKRAVSPEIVEECSNKRRKS